MITETITASQMLDAMDDLESAQEMTVHLDGIDGKFDGAFLVYGKVWVVIRWTEDGRLCKRERSQDTYLVSYEG